MINVKELKDIIENKINLSNQVFIVFHNGVDFDAIASSIGIYLIAEKLGKKAYIIIEDDYLTMDAGVKRIIDETKGYINIIRLNDYFNIKSNSDLLFCLDVNNKDLVCCKDNLEDFKNIIIIDHHNENDKTIVTDLKFIDDTASSASEIVTDLMINFKVKYNSLIANYLLSGIYLDTSRYTKNCSPKTMKMVSKLHDKGADTKIVNEYFIEDYYSDRKVHNLINKTKFYIYTKYTIAYCIEDENIIYTKEELAKVADYLLRFKVDAAFAVGYINEEIISISARSKGNIDVSKIMQEFGGGGNIYSGASKIENSNIANVELNLIKTSQKPLYIKTLTNDIK